MHQIYSQSIIAQKADIFLSRPLARLTTFVAQRPWLQRLIQKTTGDHIIDVEKETDTYNLFAVVKAEVAHPVLFSPSQKFANHNDRRYSQKGLQYLVTMVSAPDPKTGEIRQREFLFDLCAYKQLCIARPSCLKALGDGKQVIGNSLYDIGTKGQKAFAMVPRVHAVSVQKDQDSAIQTINTVLSGPKKPSRRMKIGFMNTKGL